MSSVFVINLDKPLSQDFLNRKIEVSSVIPQCVSINNVDEEIAEKLKRYNLNGYSYILGNQFISFQKKTDSFYYKDECDLAEWLQVFVTDLIQCGYKVSLISTFYGDEIEKSPQIKKSTITVNELLKDDINLDYYTVYKIMP